MNKWILLLISGFILFSCSLFENESKDDKIEIQITPAESTLNVGEESQFDLTIKNVDDLMAISVEIVFNGNILELPEESVIIGEDWGDEILSFSVNDFDRLSVAIGLIGAQEELEGSFNLFSFKLKGISLGESNLTIHKLHLLDEDGEMIEDSKDIKISNAFVTVQ